MRFAFILKEADPSRGGAQKSVSDLAGGLARLGHDVAVVPQAPSNGRAFDLAVAFSPEPGTDLYYPHGGSWRSWERQNRASAEGNTYRLFQRMRVRLSPRQREAMRAEERLLSDPSLCGVVAISARVTRDLASDYGADPKKLHLLYNGVDTRRFSPDPDARDRERRRLGWEARRVCLFAAHNFRLKGLANAVRCAAELRPDEGVLLAVAGKGDPRPYRRLAERLGCADRVRFLGAVPDLVPFYRAADVLLQPTFYDPCSLTTLEALACGLPVVTSGWNGAGEPILELGGGTVVDDPRDAAGAAQAIRTLASPGRREAAGAEARRLAEGFSEEKWLARAADLFERIAGKKV